MSYDAEQAAARRREYQRQYQRQYRQELRAWRKEHNLCVRCGKSKPAKDRVLCLDCLDMNSVYAYAYRARLKSQGRQLQFDFKEWLDVG